ncbi:MAG TPA: gliding motility-associated C-terminal domain-containing protein [Bacteroidetes bacterium]|nr:gliding motility-associated C-terminal domain-containing protein [Bacteroidota bacterium]
MLRLIYVSLFFLNISLAVAQPCNFPLPPANTCAQAPLLCNLDGYCSNNSAAVNSGTPNAFCGQVENNNWVSFIAGSTTFVLEITFSNCNQGAGMQAQIFATDDCQFFTSFSNCIDGGGNGSFTLTASDLVIGNTYYLMMDGKGGDVCDYEYKLLSGTTLSPAHAEIQPAGILCENGTLVLDAVATSTNNNLTYQWSTEDGRILSGAQTTSIEIDTAGTYKIVIVDSGGCTDSSEITVPIMPLPQINIAPPDTLNCLTNTIIDLRANSNINSGTYIWSTQNGHIVSGENTAEPAVDLPGIYQVIIIDATSGCTNSTSVEVVADTDTPVAIASGGGELNCLTETLALNGTGSSAGNNFSYFWTTDTGNIISGGNTLMPLINAAGTYILEVTSATNGCKTTDSTLVVLNEKMPTGAAFSIVNPCFGEAAGQIKIESVIGGTAPYLYSFDGIVFQSSNSMDLLPPAAYQITIQDAIGCEWDTLVNIVEQPELIVFLGDDMEAQLGCEINLKARVNFLPEQIDSVIWTPAFDCNDCYEQKAIPLESTNYKIKVIDINGCTAEDQINVAIIKNRLIYIPNAFSPNNDGINDVFFINGGKGISEILDFKIFNRWGVLMASFHNFSPNDLVNGWDGRMKGEDLDNGVYVYFAKVKFIDGEVLLFEGDVTLVK